MENATTDRQPRNNVVYSHVKKKGWVMRERYFDPRSAAAHAERIGGIVIDLVSGQMIYWREDFCNRARPGGIKDLPPVEKWETEDKPMSKIAIITAEEAERRDLRVVESNGHAEYHVTLWGAEAPKVQMAVLANSPEEAEDKGLYWGRNVWWRDKREIGVEKVEQVFKPVIQVCAYIPAGEPHPALCLQVMILPGKFGDFLSPVVRRDDHGYMNLVHACGGKPFWMYNQQPKPLV